MLDNRSTAAGTGTGVSENFWADMAPCEHGLELHESDAELLDALEGFASAGLEFGEGVIVIARPERLRALHLRLGARAHFLKAIERDQYIPVDAERALAEFMDDGWPDSSRFDDFVLGLVARARGHGRRLRVFGELVALLWTGGHNAATVHLEHLWKELCEAERLSLLCAYPRDAFAAGPVSSSREICDLHARVHWST
jgi:hypothetical protein